MSWSSATRKSSRLEEPEGQDVRPRFVTEKVDWARLVSLDFETFYDADYTLSKLSTSEYIRDPRFEAQMVGIKIGRRKTKVVPAPRIREELAKIDWSTHSLLCHHTQFDGFILSHHYGIQPKRLYCTLSMARGLHSNDIGAGLDEVAQFYGGRGKIEGALDGLKGRRYAELIKLHKDAWKEGVAYCANDVDEMFRIFEAMLPQVPVEEMDIIDITCRLFTDPVLKVDTERVRIELDREVLEKEELLLSIVGTLSEVAARLLTIQPKGKAQIGWTPRQCLMEEARASLGSNNRFVELLRAEGIEPPRKISPAYFKHRDETKKFAWAFSKTDLEFTALQEHPSKRVRDLVEARLAVKSTLSETRAARFLKAGENGQSLPVYLRYAAAHTLRWGGGNKMNMQNLPRGGELRKSIKAPPGHVIVVVDSGQIEARVNAWLWGQEDLLADFRRGDAGQDRDVYCKFADAVYGREITKADKDERFVGKVAVLGLGYQMGAPKFQNTLALGAMGPPVYFELDVCQKIVQTYRRKNYKIVQGWKICTQIIADMAAGRTGSYGPLTWEKERIWLPNGMSLKYPGLKQVVTEEGGEEWRYKRKGEDAKIYGGLLCLAGDTEVLTSTGWKPLARITTDDLVWDGESWVRHEGLVLQGIKRTTDFGGVRMTPDHRVLTDAGWIEAQHATHYEATSSFERHYWAPSRSVSSEVPSWFRRTKDALVSAMRLRKREDPQCFRVSQRQDKVVRVFDVCDAAGDSEHSRHEPAPSVLRVAEHEGTLLPAIARGVEKLRCARGTSLPRVARSVRELLGGHGAFVCARTNAGEDQQRSRVQLDQLQIGDVQGTGEQSEEAVFDLINAGPHHRFTVRGADKRPFLVHNCENIVQALARIIVGLQLLRISKKYRVVMTTHDEVAALARTRSAKVAYEFMLKQMRIPPEWCADIPLNADGGYDVIYSK